MQTDAFRVVSFLLHYRAQRQHRAQAVPRASTVHRLCSAQGLLTARVGELLRSRCCPQPHLSLSAGSIPGAGPYLRPARSCTLWRLCELLRRAPLLLPVQERPLPLRCWMLRSRPQGGSARRRSGLHLPAAQWSGMARHAVAER